MIQNGLDKGELSDIAVDIKDKRNVAFKQGALGNLRSYQAQVPAYLVAADTEVGSYLGPEYTKQFFEGFLSHYFGQNISSEEVKEHSLPLKNRLVGYARIILEPKRFATAVKAYNQIKNNDFNTYQQPPVAESYAQKTA